MSSTRSSKAYVASIDFDGCMGNAVFADAYQKLLAQYKNPYLIPIDSYGEAIAKSNPGLIRHLLSKVGQYDEMVLIVGSNRQDAYTERMNSERNRNGLACLAMMGLQNYLDQALQGKLKVEVDRYYIADSYMREQHESEDKCNFSQSIESEEAFHKLANRQKEMSTLKSVHDNAKGQLLWLQMQKVCADRRQMKVDFEYFEDRSDILHDAKETLSGVIADTMLPSNLDELKFYRYYKPYDPIVAAELDLYQAVVKKQGDVKPAVTAWLLAAKQLFSGKNDDYANQANKLIAEYEQKMQAASTSDEITKLSEGILSNKFISSKELDKNGLLDKTTPLPDPSLYYQWRADAKRDAFDMRGNIMHELVVASNLFDKANLSEIILNILSVANTSAILASSSERRPTLMGSLQRRFTVSSSLPQAWSSADSNVSQPLNKLYMNALQVEYLKKELNDQFDVQIDAAGKDTSAALAMYVTKKPLPDIQLNQDHPLRQLNSQLRKELETKTLDGKKRLTGGEYDQIRKDYFVKCDALVRPEVKLTNKN